MNMSSSKKPSESKETPSLDSLSDKELFLLYKKDRSVTIRNELVKRYLFIAEILSRKYINKGIDYEDIYQVASLGLIYAIERFDTDRGYEFSSFATPTIIGEIKKYFRDKGWSIRVPRRIQELSKKINTTKATLQQELQRTPKIKDIATYLNCTEEEIIKANKLESISLLAGGISHEFNNILAAVSGNISLSLKNMKQDDKNYKRLKNAEKSIEKAKELTVQIQTFARGGDPVKTTACIKEIIQEVIPFVVIGSNVQYRLHISDDLALVYVDAGQISQVINNLAVNALQAMPEGGLINISAENVLWGQEKDECACPLNYGEYVKVMIQDSGIGIDKRNFKKIFDPFFSTKIEGSGMGLATSYSIIKRNGGCIKVESEPGEGTVFSIYLPIASKNSCDVTN